MRQGTPHSRYKSQQTDPKGCAVEDKQSDTDFRSDDCFIYFFHYFCLCTPSLFENHQLPYKNKKESDMYSNPDQLSQQQRFTVAGVFVCFVLRPALQGTGISQQTSSS